MGEGGGLQVVAPSPTCVTAFVRNGRRVNHICLTSRPVTLARSRATSSRNRCCVYGQAGRLGKADDSPPPS